MTTDELLKQCGFQTSDKVVCQDDTYQRIDLAQTPDGLLVQGRVYCVSGISECGGLLLAGRRAVSLRTGRQLGFHPSRFCRLDQIGQRFPQGLSDPPNEGAVRRKAAKPKAKRDALPMIEGLIEPRPLLLEAIEVMEACCFASEEEAQPPWLDSGFLPDGSPKQVRSDLLQLLRSPELHRYVNQAGLFWSRLIRNETPTVVFCRNYSPVALTLFQICIKAQTFEEPFLKGCFQESDFPPLTEATGRLVNSPIRYCDVREPDTFLKVLFEAHPSFAFALCDWNLAGEELAAAYRMTRDSQIVFVRPH